MIHNQQLHPHEEDDSWEEIPPGEISGKFGVGLLLVGVVLIFLSLAGMAKCVI